MIPGQREAPYRHQSPSHERSSSSRALGREARQNLVFSPHRIPFQSAAESERVRESAATGYLPHRRTDRSGMIPLAHSLQPARNAAGSAERQSCGCPRPHAASPASTLCTGIPQLCPHPLHDQAAVQLRDGTQDGKRSRCAWKGFERRDQRAESEKERAEATWKELRGVECVERRRLSFSGHALH